MEETVQNYRMGVSRCPVWGVKVVLAKTASANRTHSAVKLNGMVFVQINAETIANRTVVLPLRRYAGTGPATSMRTAACVQRIAAAAPKDSRGSFTLLLMWTLSTSSQIISDRLQATSRMEMEVSPSL